MHRRRQVVSCGFVQEKLDFFLAHLADGLSAVPGLLRLFIWLAQLALRSKTLLSVVSLVQVLGQLLARVGARERLVLHLGRLCR